MTDVDPASGLPRSEVPKSVNQNVLNRLGEQKAKADRLSIALESDPGKEILNKIHNQLMTRVNELISDDGECKALKKLLLGIGVTLDIGRMAANRLVDMTMRK